MIGTCGAIIFCLVNSSFFGLSFAIIDANKAASVGGMVLRGCDLLTNHGLLRLAKNPCSFFSASFIAKSEMMILNWYGNGCAHFASINLKCHPPSIHLIAGKTQVRTAYELGGKWE